MELSSHSGLALVGMVLNRYTNLTRAAKQTIPKRHGIPHAHVLKSYIGLLCLGKSDFEAVSGVREDEFFQTAMGIGAVPSPETLRQRLDNHAESFLPLVVEAGTDFLVNIEAKCTTLKTGHVPLDADVTPFDNSQTRKEGVSRTSRATMVMPPWRPILGGRGIVWNWSCG